jgi:C-terminal processing protease CtpA/Prc
VLILIGNGLHVTYLENTFDVSLIRGQNGLGMSLVGGSTEKKPIEIIEIYPNQPAALSGRLRPGDIILSINDIPMHNRNVRVRY